MLQRLFLFAGLFLGLARPLAAASFNIEASVDRDELELGESLRYQLRVTSEGRLDFPVQVDQPKFEGFQAHGPGRSDSSSWVNGSVSEEHIFTWDLVPIKAGTLQLPPVKANAKTAAAGEIIKSTAGFNIKVKRPKNAYQGLAPQPTPLPTYALQQQAGSEPTPALGDEGLRGIKKDRGLPFGAIGLVFGAFAAVYALLIWLARRPAGEEESALPEVKDARAQAFKELDAAWRRLEAKDEKGFSLAVARALRDYLRRRLDLRQEVTLAEALRQGGRRIPDTAQREAARVLLLRLELLLYGDDPLKDTDPRLLDESSRALINTLERLAGR